MWIASLPAPVLVAGCVCLTFLLVSLLFLVACVPGAVERIILILDAVHNLFYGESQHSVERRCHRKYSRMSKKGEV